MDIAVIGNEKRRRDDLEANIRACLGRDTPIKLTQIEMSRPRNELERPDAPTVVFIIIDEPNALLTSELVAEWGEDYPMVRAATHPQYALEGIRQKVRHYILLQLERKEIEEALKRAGVLV